MIDKLTGSLVLENGNIDLNPSTSIESFMTTPLYKGGDIKTGYSLKNPEPINGKTFLITLYFVNEKIKEIHLSEVSGGLSWSDWTEDIEIKKKSSHDEWLVAILGKAPYQYSWGQIESVYDKKGCVSSIIVRYV